MNKTRCEGQEDFSHGVHLHSGSVWHDGVKTENEKVVLEKATYGYMIDRKTSTVTFIKNGHDMGKNFFADTQ